jgi:ankyrin repeat protein
LSDGYTVLHSAIHRGNQELVIYLLENSKKAKETLNQATNEGITPLMLACQMPIFFVKFLISQGANAKLKTKNDLTALDLAVKNNNLPLCQLLLPLCPLSAQTIETAIKKSSLEINQLLAQQDTYLKYCNALGDTPLIMALKYANLPVATHILSLTSDSELLNTKNKLNESALQFAIQGQFYTVLEDLLKRNINTTPYALFKELLKNDYQGDQPYLENYINQALFTPSEVQQLLLTAALAGNYVAISNLLIPRGANLDTFQGPSGERIEYYLAQSDGIFLFRKQFMKQSALLLNLVSQEGKTLYMFKGYW